MCLLYNQIFSLKKRSIVLKPTTHHSRIMNRKKFRWNVVVFVWMLVAEVASFSYRIICFYFCAEINFYLFLLPTFVLFEEQLPTFKIKPSRYIGDDAWFWKEKKRNLIFIEQNSFQIKCTHRNLFCMLLEVFDTAWS